METDKKYVDFGTDGCLCKDEDRYSVECCDEDDRWAEPMGLGLIQTVIQVYQYD